MPYHSFSLNGEYKAKRFVLDDPLRWAEEGSPPPAYEEVDHVLVRNHNPSAGDLQLLSVSDPDLQKNAKMPPPPPSHVPYKNGEKYLTEEGKHFKAIVIARGLQGVGSVTSQPITVLLTSD